MMIIQEQTTLPNMCLLLSLEKASITCMQINSCLIKIGIKRALFQDHTIKRTVADAGLSAQPQQPRAWPRSWGLKMTSTSSLFSNYLIVMMEIMAAQADGCIKGSSM